MDLKQYEASKYTYAHEEIMGYTTDFQGAFSVEPTLKPEDREFLQKFSKTRRMQRNLGPAYGVEGEFYVDGSGPAGQDEDLSVVNYSSPPKTQPSLWCDWAPTEDGNFIEWNGTEKFYGYIEWIKYLIDNFLAPKGYEVNGVVAWFGEEQDDRGQIIVRNNKVFTKEATLVYGKEKPVE